MSYSDLKDKVAILTGAAEGIGFAISELLIQNGCSVAMNDINSELGQSAANQLNHNYKGKCLFVDGDASEIATIDKIVNAAIAEFGRVDFVIPNAGITLFGDFLEFTPESFQKVTALNLQGAFFLVQRVAKEFIRQGSGGKVILMSSQVGIRAYRHLTAYAMTKAALQMMAINLAYELGNHQINVNVVAPGATLTNRTAKEQPDYEGSWSKLNPNNRVGTPEDVAKTCLFLLSDASSHINGQTISIDGGWTTAGKYPEDL